jgi:hypothetical protein
MKINNLRQNLAIEEKGELMVAMDGVVGRWLSVLSVFDVVIVGCRRQSSWVVAVFPYRMPFFKETISRIHDVSR